MAAVSTVCARDGAAVADNGDGSDDGDAVDGVADRGIGTGDAGNGGVGTTTARVAVHRGTSSSSRTLVRKAVPRRGLRRRRDEPPLGRCGGRCLSCSSIYSRR